MAVVSNDFLEQLKGTLEKVEKCLKEEAKDSPMWMWVKSEEAREMLGVSRKTWRDKKYIPFSQFGQKIYYHLDDLNNFMEEHKIEVN